MTAGRAGTARVPVVITGLGAACALGRGTSSLLAGIVPGQPVFSPLTRFDPRRCRATAAATMPGSPVLAEEMAAVVNDACEAAALSPDQRRTVPLLAALHTDPAAAREASPARITGGAADEMARRVGLAGVTRTYTTACVASSTAVADAAVMIGTGRAERVLVAAGFLLDADCHAMFDAGRALAPDGSVRPFSQGRRGMLLGDGIAAVVLESAPAAHRRGADVYATLAGWGRSGDAYHVCQPHPEGTGLARAISAALDRAGVSPPEIGFVNASGTGTPHSDAAEAAALHLAFGPAVAAVPVSSTKSVHGHALEASALLELVVTVLTLRAGEIPVNAGYLGPDDSCDLDLVLGAPRRHTSRYALTVNAAFGGANTALLVAA